MAVQIKHPTLLVETIKTAIAIHQNAMASRKILMIQLIHIPPLHYLSMANVRNSRGGPKGASGVVALVGAQNKLNF